MKAFGSRRKQILVPGGTPPTGPDIAWYLLNEGSGTTANDSSGSGLNSPIVDLNGGTAGWVTWSDGSDALEFVNPDSTTNAAHIGVINSSAIHSIRSISVWVRVQFFPNVNNRIRIIFGKGYDGSSEEMQFGFVRTYDGYNTFNWLTYTGTNQGIEFSVADWASWGTDTDIHLVGTRGASLWSLYKDGQLLTTSSDSTALNANNVPITVGATTINGSVTRAYTGSMKDFRLYSSELTAGEVSALYAAGPQG